MCEALVGTASETCRSNDDSGFRSYNGSLWYQNSRSFGLVLVFDWIGVFLEAVVLGAGTALSLLPEVLGIDAYRIWLQPRRLDRLYWSWQDGTALRKMPIAFLWRRVSMVPLVRQRGYVVSLVDCRCQTIGTGEQNNTKEDGRAE
jgi:hypothetical protein